MNVYRHREKAMRHWLKEISIDAALLAALYCGHLLPNNWLLNMALFGGWFLAICFSIICWDAKNMARDVPSDKIGTLLGWPWKVYTVASNVAVTLSFAGFGHFFLAAIFGASVAILNTEFYKGLKIREARESRHA